MKTNINSIIAWRFALAVSSNDIPVGGFVKSLCDTYLRADSGNKAKILKGFEADFLGWNEIWGAEVNSYHAASDARY